MSNAKMAKDAGWQLTSQSRALAPPAALRLCPPASPLQASQPASQPPGSGAVGGWAAVARQQAAPSVAPNAAAAAAAVKTAAPGAAAASTTAASGPATTAGPPSHQARHRTRPAIAPARLVSQNVLCAWPSFVRTTAFCATTSKPLRVQAITRIRPASRQAEDPVVSKECPRRLGGRWAVVGWLAGSAQDSLCILCLCMRR